MSPAGQVGVASHALVARLARRRVLVASVVAGALTVSGCDDVLVDAQTGGAEGPAAIDPDQALLDAAVREEMRVADAVRRLVRSAPRRLRSDLRTTLAVHDAHLRLLSPDPLPRQAPSPLTVRGLASAEERASRRHGDLAVQAVSGQFARVLAGMAAASAQQADLWRGRG